MMSYFFNTPWQPSYLQCWCLSTAQESSRPTLRSIINPFTFKFFFALRKLLSLPVAYQEQWWWLWQWRWWWWMILTMMAFISDPLLDPCYVICHCCPLHLRNLHYSFFSTLPLLYLFLGILSPLSETVFRHSTLSSLEQHVTKLSWLYESSEDLIEHAYSDSVGP